MTGCDFGGCSNPHGSTSYHVIRDQTHAFAKDWTTMVGCVLCDACFQRFGKNGTLEKKTRPQSTRRCGNTDCAAMCKKDRLQKIEPFYSAGGQDWSTLEGIVLCRKCYERFWSFGTLKDPIKRNISCDDQGELPTCCTYNECPNNNPAKPLKMCRMQAISPFCTAGGQDWTSLSGSILCGPCYQKFRITGSLERRPDEIKVPKGHGVKKEARVCSFTACPGTTAQYFYRTSPFSTAGGQDWTYLNSGVLCFSCYHNYKKCGSLLRPDMFAAEALTEF
jgi:hypothetical protein